ncbi:MAG TPA: DUF3325 domain-containing protein [Hyphomicrobiales bacterium]|nr:DUF3325 domain-containing protein [Hyphomicrobiales bacterium]
MTTLAFALCFLGFICLSLSMNRHYRQLWPQGTPSRTQVWTLRGVGYCSLALALAPAIAAQGTAVGIVLWCGLLTVAALLQAMLLTYRPLWITRCGAAVLLVGAVAASL